MTNSVERFQKRNSLGHCWINLLRWMFFSLKICFCKKTTADCRLTLLSFQEYTVDRQWEETPFLRDRGATQNTHPLQTTQNWNRTRPGVQVHERRRVQTHRLDNRHGNGQRSKKNKCSTRGLWVKGQFVQIRRYKYILSSWKRCKLFVTLPIAVVKKSASVYTICVF